MKKKFTWKSPEFVISATHPKFYPTLKTDQGKILPEIAFIGRSNVGKSSLINDLVKDKIARTSSTPGKTQLINFFNIDRELCLVDLPGYGFAKVPLEVKEAWAPMIQKYLDKREPLHLVLLLFDIRREPNDEDMNLMEWIAQAGKGVILVITKVDKVTPQELKNKTKLILEQFNVPHLHYVHYSVPKKKGREELIKMIDEALEEYKT